MDKNNLIRIPISYDQRMRNQKGIGYIPCEVSGRYILFNDYVDENGILFLDVRTDNGDKDRKLCEMIIHFDDLVNFVEKVRDARKQ